MKRQDALDYHSSGRPGKIAVVPQNRSIISAISRLHTLQDAHDLPRKWNIEGRVEPRGSVLQEVRSGPNRSGLVRTGSVRRKRGDLRSTETRDGFRVHARQRQSGQRYPERRGRCCVGEGSPTTLRKGSGVRRYGLLRRRQADFPDVARQLSTHHLT